MTRLRKAECQGEAHAVVLNERRSIPTFCLSYAFISQNREEASKPGRDWIDPVPIYPLIHSKAEKHYQI
jgi:hypothetical protein